MIGTETSHRKALFARLTLKSTRETGPDIGQRDSVRSQTEGRAYWLSPEYLSQTVYWRGGFEESTTAETPMQPK